jgi:hypothetical protein
VPLHQADIIYNWDEPQVLSWDLYDVTAHSWALLVNDAETDNETWSPTNYRLNWAVPLLDVGFYNITLVVVDDLGQINTTQCYITVLAPDSPYILTSPGDSTLIWGSEGVSFIWEVAGGTQWSLYRNNELLDTDEITGYVVELTIDDWRAENWRPGLYNLTLVNTLDNLTAVDTIWVEIVADAGDPYVDEYLPDRSQGYLSGENTIGAPDGQYATLYTDYEDGYISLDMGENEEIVNGPGADFTVEAQGGSYRVFVTNSLETMFELVGTGNNQTDFDLDSSSLEEARYVRIQYLSGDDVELDAIVAINYNTPPADTTPPTLTFDGGSHNLVLGANTTLVWNASDDTPWSYEIYVNSNLALTEFWDGSQIQYLFEPTAVGQWNVTIVAHDAFGNFATDTVMVDVRNPSDPTGGMILVMIGGLTVGVSALVLFIIWMKKKKSP